MPWQAEVRESTVREEDGSRIVVIPNDFVLVGDRIIVRQEKDGVITIHPATEEGRRALDPFNPFYGWEEDENG